MLVAAMGRRGRSLVLSPVLVSLLVLPLTPQGRKQEEFPPHDTMTDDADDAVQRVRTRLAVKDNTTTASLGIVMVSSIKDQAVSKLTTPIWQAYCKRHGMGFFLQEEPLLTSELSFNWATTRVLIEILSHLKWKYLLLVEANSLPKKMGTSWEYMVKQHMRHRRYSNDKTDDRHIFCPWECEEEYDSPYTDGACHGPALHGCIFWAKKPKTKKLVQTWHAKRKDEDLPQDSTALSKALAEVHKRHHNEIYLKDIAEDVGKKSSKFIPLFTWDEAYGWNVRDQIYDFIKKDKKLSKVANDAAKTEL